MSSFADLEKTIKANALGIQDLIGMMDKFAGSTKKVITSTDDLSKAQRSLGLDVDKHNKLINSAGAFVDSYGREVTRAGESTGKFNKRTSIMAATVSSFSKQGKAVSFLQGYSKYIKLGGSRLEYFAEYLTSAKEELTIFGVEAAQARKVMYGFLPPGMFRMVNKLSSSFRFFGGNLRKLRSGFSDSAEQIKNFKEALAVAVDDNNLHDIEKLSELIMGLEAAKPPVSFFGAIMKGFTKVKTFVNEPLFAKIEMDTQDTKRLIKKFAVKDMIMVKGQFKHRLAKELKQMQSPLKRFKKKFEKNFLLNLTPDKKQQIKDLKAAIKTAKKFEISKVSLTDQKKKQKSMGIGAGVNDDKIVALSAEFSTLNDEVSKAEAKVKRIQASIDGGNTGAWSKRNDAQRELNELLDKETKTQRELVDEKTKYSTELNKIATLGDAQTALVEENAKLIIDSEKEIDSIRTKGLQGYRKRLVDLGEAYNEHNKRFTEGTDKFDNAISKTKAVINSIDLNELGKEMDALGKSSAKRAEEEQKIRDEIANYKPIMGIGSVVSSDGSGTELKESLEIREAMEEKLAVLVKTSKREGEITALIDKKAKAEKQLSKFQLKARGSKELIAEIKRKKETLAVTKKQLSEVEKLIKTNNKKIKQSEKAQKAIKKEYKMLKAAAEDIPEQIQLSLEMDAKLAKEVDKMNAATADMNQAEGRRDRYVGEANVLGEGLEEDNGQLDALDTIKEEATKKLLAKFPILGTIFKGWKYLTKTILPLLGQGLRMFVMGFIYISLAILGIILIMKAFGPQIIAAFTKTMEFIQPFFDLIWHGLLNIWDGASKVLNGLFGGGSFSEAVDGLLQIAFGLLEVAFGVVMVVLAGLLTFLFHLTIEVAKGIWKSIKEAFTDSKKMAKLIVKVVAVVVMIALLFTTAPIWLVLVIGLVIWKVGTKLLKPITMGVTAVSNALKAIGNGLINLYNGMMTAIEKIPGVKNNSITRLEKYEYTAFAKGGVTTGGLSLVGEEGPELVTLPKGATVHNNSKSQSMANALSKGNTSNSQSIVNNFNITINSKDSSSAELNRVADQVARKIGNKVNRMTGSGSFV